LLSSHTHDRQAAALRKTASPRRAQAQVKARMAAAVLGGQGLTQRRGVPVALQHGHHVVRVATRYV